MRNTLILFFSSFLLSFSLSAQEDWQRFAIDDYFDVSFPGIAEQVDTFEQRLLYLEQDSLVFFVSKASGKTPHVSDIHKLEEYYDGLVNGFVDQTASRLLDEQAFALEALKGREIRVEFTYPSTSSGFGPLRDSSASLQKDIREVRFLLFQEHTYVLQFWYSLPADEAELAIGERFFSSFRPRQAVDREMQFVGAPEMEDGLNPWIGESVLYIALVLLIVFVYMLVRYAARSRRL